MNNIYNGYEEKARDTVRITDLNSIENSIWNHFIDHGKYPENLDEIKKYLYKEIKDPKEGEKSKNGCEFTYKYEKFSDIEYKVSFCPESIKNIEKAKNDGGTDEKLYEIIKKS